MAIKSVMCDLAKHGIKTLVVGLLVALVALLVVDNAARMFARAIGVIMTAGPGY
jgi:hypothetical protein